MIKQKVTLLNLQLFLPQMPILKPWKKRFLDQFSLFICTMNPGMIYVPLSMEHPLIVSQVLYLLKIKKLWILGEKCFLNLLGISTSMISPLVQLWVNSHLGEAGHREQMIRPDHH